MIVVQTYSCGKRGYHLDFLSMEFLYNKLLDTYIIRFNSKFIEIKGKAALKLF